MVSAQTLRAIADLAAVERRSLSSMAEKIIAEWFRENSQKDDNAPTKIPPSAGDIVDENFTGGVESAEYLRRLRNGGTGES